jgi:hypothetical protein
LDPSPQSAIDIQKITSDILQPQKKGMIALETTTIHMADT